MARRGFPGKNFPGLPLFLAVVAAGCHAAAASSRPWSPSGPGRVLQRFDSLMDAGAFAQAKSLCMDQALQLFDVMALAQAKITPLIDTARSRDDFLAADSAGSWAYVKAAGYVAFKKPVLGQSEMTSFEAVHFYRGPQGWRIAGFEELENAQAPVRMRSGSPAASPLSDSGKTNLFPFSSLSPGRDADADSMRYVLRFRNGKALAGFCPTGTLQRKAEEKSSSAWVLVNRKPSAREIGLWSKRGFPKGLSRRPASALDPQTTGNASSRTARFRQAREGGSRTAANSPGDTLQSYLESNPYLDLSDSLLLRTARRLAGGEKDPLEVTRRVYRWVAANFHFQVGAVLFGNSREILRNRTGDCSEAAVLAAALLRAEGIPARVALGFAGTGQGAFIGHAWTEAWLGEWLGVDAALRQFPAGVERVKLAELGGGDMRAAAANLMLSTLSNLDVEILAMWKDGEPLPLRASSDGEAGERFFETILNGIGNGSAR